jgi:C4-dicarboxylate transporter DctM subunit
MFLLMVNILFLILGCFVDDVSAMLILAPLFLATLNQYGIDLVHFGIIMVLNIQIGMLTPPFGLNLFVAAGITKRPLVQVSCGVIPFLGIMLICLALVTYIPWISLVLPKIFLN